MVSPLPSGGLKVSTLGSKLMNMDTSTALQAAEAAEREVDRSRSIRPHPSSRIKLEGTGDV